MSQQLIDSVQDSKGTCSIRSSIVLRAGVRITLAWPCTCTDRPTEPPPPPNLYISPVQHCPPVRCAFSRGSSGLRRASLWENKGVPRSRSSSMECLRQAKIREITSCTFVLIIRVSKMQRSMCCGTQMGSRARVLEVRFALYNIGAWKLQIGLFRAVVVSSMSDSMTVEPGFSNCGVTGDTQRARESSRSSELGTCNRTCDMVSEGIVTTPTTLLDMSLMAHASSITLLEAGPA